MRRLTAQLYHHFSFKGRLNRQASWLMILVLFIINSLLISVISTLMIFVLSPVFGEKTTTYVAYFLICTLIIFFIISAFSIAVRRLHDRNKSGWWSLFFTLLPIFLTTIATGIIGVVEYIGFFFFVILILASFAIITFAFVELGFLKGTDGPNPYGSDPLAPIIDTNIFN